ncbi:hypothetical protein GCM10017673_06250 [Streptosporangium violaceochromogenes]|nr:hypothetical protein GCM10017673_06250 [Streptosporangium violaceochromogenes]
MNEEFSARETWPMECLHCWHIWLEEYVVRRLTDRYGHEVALWFRGGTLVQSPWSGTTCPTCGHSRVTTFPPGSRSHEVAAAALTTRPVDTRLGGADAGTTRTAPPRRVVAPAGGPARVRTSGRAAGRRAVRKAREGTERPAAGRPAPGPHRQPFLLYALLGGAFLLLTGFTLVEYVVLHH